MDLIRIIDSWKLSARNDIVADIQHSLNGLGAETVLRSDARGLTWRVVARIIFQQVIGQKQFIGETKHFQHFVFRPIENLEKFVRDIQEKESLGIYQYAIQPIGHDKKPENGEILRIEKNQISGDEGQIHYVTSFEELVGAAFSGETNAICWARELAGDFSEIVNGVELRGNITAVEEGELWGLKLSEQGRVAREILLNDLELLKGHGASPVLNVISYYDRDDDCPVLPTDVYSFHVDRSPIPTDTFLCTYYGESSEILPNSQGRKKVLIPEIRDELRKLYDGADEGFESFLSEHFFDLHYQALADARPISLGLGNLWRLAVDHPESRVPPCIHRAPQEKSGEKRLLLIC